LKRKDVIFLGFPDAVLSNLIEKYPSGPWTYTSPFTLVNHPPAPDVILRHTDYNGRSVIKEIMWELADFRPNLVATTPSAGQHPDHCATHYFVAKALKEMGRKDSTIKPKVLAFLIHFRHWPMDTAAGSCLNPPEGFPNKAHERQIEWLSLSLSPEESETKHQAILQYHTQMLDMGNYMLSFVRPNELFMVEHPESADEMQEIPWCEKGVLN
jgi:LmbE family N-acetylglucosaminyl deacetylase